ncbi:MAG: gluconate 2-dehydrogenase subunit 3 family protein [Actinobacteria bacterium]|nr:gluconate 2-dehydrogenase subunit 3 family protein [Actinomycetota bacterium]
MEERSPALTTLNPHEARTVAAVFERLFPADEHGPGATEIGVLTYVDRSLVGAYRDKVETYRLGLAALDHTARRRYGACFSDCQPEQQDALITGLEQAALPGFRIPPQRDVLTCRRDSSPIPHMAATARSWAGSSWAIQDSGSRIPSRRISRPSPPPRAASSDLSKTRITP